MDTSRKIYMSFLLILSLSLSLHPVFSQNSSEFYPRYEIYAELLPKSHLLKAEISMSFINVSGRPLDSVFLLLYPNAYTSSATAFGEQQLRFGYENFHFAAPTEKGSMTGLNFSVNNKSTPYLYYKGQKDIACLVLKDPIPNGDTVHISTPFTVKTPRLFSRMGYEKSTFQISQWFPKLAKFTEDSWRVYPYLDLGEFYGDFADYTVKITLPSDYIVASTGVLLTETEKTWYRDLSKDSTAQNPHQMKKKTLLYRAERVQDFAWFTSPDFNIEYSELDIAENKVECWVYYRGPEKDIWKNAMKYCQRSLTLFSKWVGPYRYPQMTVVGAHLESGAGMEYPMVSLIGNFNSEEDLDAIIAHEVGHNWFYGMIASDERQFPILDEGLTSQLEMRYMQTFYGSDYHHKSAIDRYPYSYEEYYYWDRIKKQIALDYTQITEGHSEFSYYLLNYRMMPNALEFMRYYVGDDKWDKMMHKLYKKYLFRHLSPQDLQDMMKENLDIDVDWLFRDYLTGGKTYDYTFKEVSLSGDSIYCLLKNGSGLEAPFILQQLKHDSLLWEGRFLAFVNEESVSIPYLDSATHLRIYSGNLLSSYKADKLYDLHTEKIGHKNLNLGLLLGYEPPEFQSIFFVPLMAYNKYDGFMVGIGMHNITLPAHNLQFQVLPYFGLESKELAGLFNLYYDIYHKSQDLNRIRFSVEGRKYNSFYNDRYDFMNSFVKLKSAVAYRFKQSYVAYHETEIHLSHNLIHEKYGVGLSIADEVFQWKERHYNIFEAGIIHDNNHPITPYSLELKGTTLKKDWRLTMEINGSYKFRSRMKVGLRFFTGIADTDNSSHPSLQFYLTGTPGIGNLDYGYDAFMLGRGETEGVLAQQVFKRDLSFPLPVMYPLGTQVIGGDFYLKTELGFVSIQPYFYYSSGNADLSDNRFLYTMGGRITLADDIIKINFPFVSSDVLERAMELQGHKTYLSRITFSIDIARLLPEKLLSRVFSLE